jgi:phosphate/sulfate permease
MKNWNPSEWSEFFEALSTFIMECALSMSFIGGVVAIMYGLMFVTQPMWGQSKNDVAMFAILTPLMIFLPTIIREMISKKQERKAQRDAKAAAAAPAPQEVKDEPAVAP